jgi:hypothetical protein
LFRPLAAWLNYLQSVALLFAQVFTGEHPMGVIPKADRQCQLSARAGARVPPLIAHLLADEYWFANKPPSWPDAPTANAAKKGRIRRIKRLLRFSSQFSEAKKLAKILARCKRRRRCMSGACPECGRAFQRWFVAEVVNLTSNDSPLDLIAVSIAFPHHRSVGDTLDTLDTTKMKRDMTEIIKDSDLVHWMAGGIDLSLNDDTQRNVPICWQGQLYGFTEVFNRRKFSKLLRDAFKKTRKVKRPIQTEECDGSSRAISYGFKNDFVRRIGYRGQAGPPDNRRTCWKTRKVSLRPTEHVRAMLWLHKVGIAGRLFLRGVRMTRGKNGVALVQIKKQE